MFENSKRSLAVSLALLALPGCAPYEAPPPQEPYAAPPEQAPYGAPQAPSYPTPETYTPQPYTPQSYPPAPGANYPGQPYEPGQAYPPYPPGHPAPPECPVTASREWSAWINAMAGPNSRPSLIVTGKVVTATGGYQVAFDQRMQVRRGQPPQAFVTLFVAPPTSPTTQVPSTYLVRWDWPLPEPVGSVVVRCGDKTLAEITNIQTAF